MIYICFHRNRKDEVVDKLKVGKNSMMIKWVMNFSQKTQICSLEDIFYVIILPVTNMYFKREYE